ncbi:ATP-dependent RNA helicase ddx51 [Dermatophagoides pteronyssinus]|uniref:ATP-dependent RNA helicase n=1 Tax=Dermatophagoides pteronyssinus TaxID=6956 RepID=A0ABQ8JNP4_DERPT|nr:ATP-dependent RNA helicase ddx51 [Dermatophagoides pteronyssinus]
MEMKNENSNTDNHQNEENDYFQTIGSRKKLKTIKVKPNLPKWINESVNYSGDIENNSVDLNEIEKIIDECLSNNLRKNGIEKLFPVQKEVIPKLINTLKKKRYFRPRDICVISPTGSGKTFAYSIPVIQYLLDRIVTQIRVLIILPVQDLANQVHKVFQNLCENTTLRVGLATGSSSSNMFYKPNIDGTQTICLADILIATPGKLVDLIMNNENGFHLRNLEILIIDEADRMMNETQLQWLSTIEYAVHGSSSKFYCPCLAPDNGNRQCNYNVDPFCACSTFNTGKTLLKILFSATFTTDPEKIENLSLYNPLLINMNSGHDDDKNMTEKINPVALPENLKELMVISDQDKKPLILWHLVKNLGYKRILCFANSITNAHRLDYLMKKLPELIVDELHSRQNIHKRTKILKKFENGLIHILISTDVTARGMDIDGIDCVVSYDLPRNETAYIHRIGRTARAGKQGTAITLISPDQLKHFNIIIRRSHKSSSNDQKQMIEKLSIKNSDLKPLIGIYTKALEQLKMDAKNEWKKDANAKRQQLRNKSSFKS